jgi:hypothetical protein
MDITAVSDTVRSHPEPIECQLKSSPQKATGAKTPLAFEPYYLVLLLQHSDHVGAPVNRTVEMLLKGNEKNLHSSARSRLLRICEEITD